MSLELALYHAENYEDPYVREDLQQLIASLAAQLGQPTIVPTTSTVITIQRVTLTYSAGAFTATAALTTPVDLTKTDFVFLGDSPPKDGGGLATQGNCSYLDLPNTTGTTVAIKRSYAKDDVGANIGGVVVLQIRETVITDTTRSI